MAIKKGDSVVINISGTDVVAKAASDEKDGAVEIKCQGTFSTVNVKDVRSLPDYSDVQVEDVPSNGLSDGEQWEPHDGIARGNV